MKGLHYLVVLILVILIGGQQADVYSSYSKGGTRIKSFEQGDIVRVYIDDQKMIQVVDTTAYHEHVIFFVVIEFGEIVEFDVISHQETEDYGGYITQKWFKDRLLLSCDKSLEVVKLSKESDNEVVAVTGATITTEGIVNAVNICIDNYWRYLR